jgi:hypothetical protein
MTGGVGTASSGGSIYLTGGSSSSSSGGNVYLKAGTGFSSGSIYFQASSSSSNVAVISDSHFEVSVSSVVDIESSSSLDLTSSNGMTLSSTNGVDLDSGWVSGYEFLNDESKKWVESRFHTYTMNSISGQFIVEPVPLPQAQNFITIYNDRATAGDMIITQLLDNLWYDTCWDIHVLYARCDTDGVIDITVTNNIKDYCHPNMRVKFYILKH